MPRRLETGRVRRRHLAVSTIGAVVALVSGACGGGAPRPDVVTGRVMSKTDRYCVSPDRGATTTCVALDQADEEAEVGECVRITVAPTPDARRLAPVDEAACAAGDLGDEAPGG